MSRCLGARWRRIAAGLVVALASGPLAGCWGTGDPPPPDTAPPVVEARPPGGTFGEVAYVTLVADEIATIEYTLDGSSPTTGAPGTFTGTNPVFWIRAGDGVTRLRFRAVDLAGNASAVRTETYEVRSGRQTLALLTPPPGPVGLLGEAVITWRSDRPVTWQSWLAPVAEPSAWTALANGLAGAGEEVTFHLPRALLAGGPATIRIGTVDGYGHAAVLDLRVEAAVPEPVGAGPSGTGAYGLLLSPDGRRAYASNGLALEAFDVDPSSPSYGARRWSSGPLWYPMGLAQEPDGRRLWVAVASYAGSGPGRFAAVDAETGAEVTAILDPRADFAGHLAVTLGGRLHAQLPGVGLVELDADPSSPNFGSQLAVRPALDGRGPLEASPDARRLLHLAPAAGPGRSGLLITDPDDPSFGLEVGSLAAQISDSPGLAAWLPGGAGLVVAGCVQYGDCGLRRYELASDLLGPRIPSLGLDALAFTADGGALLATSPSGGLAVHDPTTLEAGTMVQLPTVYGGHVLRITPDGTAALLLADGASGGSRLVRVALR